MKYHFPTDYACSFPQAIKHETNAKMLGISADLSSQCYCRATQNRFKMNITSFIAKSRRPLI